LGLNSPSNPEDLKTDMLAGLGLGKKCNVFNFLG